MHSRELRLAFGEGKQFDDIVANLRSVQRTLAALSRRPVGHMIDLRQTQDDFKNLITAVKFARPYAICPLCNAKQDKCDGCKNTGWMCKNKYVALSESERFQF